MHATTHTYGVHQRTASGSRGSPSTMWVLAIKLRPSAFATEILYAQSHLASPLVGIFWRLVVDRRRGLVI